jgi:hypothetical protein
VVRRKTQQFGHSALDHPAAARNGQHRRYLIGGGTAASSAWCLIFPNVLCSAFRLTAFLKTVSIVKTVFRKAKSQRDGAPGVLPNTHHFAVVVSEAFRFFGGK